MTANVRNFWIELDVDGKKTRIKTGPIVKDGGFSLDIKIRQDGAVSEDELYIDGIVHADGVLTVKASTKKKGVLKLLGTLLRGRR